MHGDQMELCGSRHSCCLCRAHICKKSLSIYKYRHIERIPCNWEHPIWQVLYLVDDCLHVYIVYAETLCKCAFCALRERVGFNAKHLITLSPHLPQASRAHACKEPAHIQMYVWRKHSAWSCICSLRGEVIHWIEYSFSHVIILVTIVRRFITANFILRGNIISILWEI